MREIEFEVHQEDGRLIGWERLNEGKWQFKKVNGIGDYWFDGIIDTRSNAISDFLIRRQFTGSTDKNGNKIWEGSRIKRPSSNGTHEQMAYGTVKYNRGCFYVYFDGQNKINTTFGKLSLHTEECQVIDAKILQSEK